MEDNFEIDEYIFKMLLDDEWGGHEELVTFTQLYNIKIEVFDSLGSQEPMIRFSPSKWKKYDKHFIFNRLLWKFDP